MTRRYDIDWLRVIAIGLLLIYHTAIGFQPWGGMVGFITNKESWTALWAPMMMLNVWRIPLLFFVSGMGVFFAMQKRNWKQLLLERSKRILLPLIFGMFIIVPIHLYLWQASFGMPFRYMFDSGHLWFLWNIFQYVIILFSLFYLLIQRPDSNFSITIKKLFGSPIGLLIAIAAFVLEAYLVNPQPYELYAKTAHGFMLGLLAFLFGFCFAFSGSAFWEMIKKWCWLFLVIASGLFILRLSNDYTAPSPYYLLVIESQMWIYALFGLVSRYLNRSGKVLSYLSAAAYPVYILHMVFLYLGSYFIFPLEMAAPLKYFIVLGITFLGCFGSYELIRRLAWVRPLFGLKAVKA